MYDIPEGIYVTKHHVAFEFENNIYFQGGKNKRTCGQFFMLDTQTRTIEIIEKSDSDNYCRYGHTVVVHDNKAFFYGGRDEDTTVTEPRGYDLKTKTWFSYCTSVPANVTFHTAIIHEDKMFIFGGMRGGKPVDELHAIQMTDDYKWQRITTYSRPPKRFGHVCYKSKSMVHILSGYDETGVIDPEKGYKWDTTTYPQQYPSWTEYKLDNPCGVFASIAQHNEQVEIIGGTYFDQISAAELDLFGDDILVHILTFLHTNDVLQIQALSKSARICQLTTGMNINTTNNVDDLLWSVLYDRYVPLAATKQKLTSTENCKQSYIAFQEQEIHAIFDFKLSTVENPSNHKYIGLQALLDSKPTKLKPEQMKVVLVGEGAVGKTSLIKTMCKRYDFIIY